MLRWALPSFTCTDCTAAAPGVTVTAAVAVPAAPATSVTVTRTV